MNQRFQGTLINDPDLMISVSLTNVLILNVKIFEYIFDINYYLQY